ncbi:transposase [Actinoplanes philippinensis]|nr:transposase [Actinoplanes philippinensis]
MSPHLLSAITGGRPHEDDRRFFNGIAWKIRSNTPWREVPARYGS